MSRHRHLPQERSDSASEWDPGRGTKVAVALIAGSLGLIAAPYRHGYSWAGAILAAIAAIDAAVFAYRSYWNQPRFWIPLIVLGVMQVPAVIAVRPMIEDLRFPALFIFGIADCITVLAVIYWLIYWPRS